jgi:hypothetical protein
MEEKEHQKKEKSIQTSLNNYYNLVISKIPIEQVKILYDKAWEAKKYEMDNYWRRGNYFWAFQVAAFAGYFSILSAEAYQTNPEVAFVIVCIGFVTSSAWIFTNLAGETWQRNWEIYLYLLEKKLIGTPLYKLREKPKVYSVSILNKILCVFFLFIWGVLGVKYFLNHLTFELDNKEIDWVVIISLATTVFFVILMLLARGKGSFSKVPKDLFFTPKEIEEMENPNKNKK